MKHIPSNCRTENRVVQKWSAGRHRPWTSGLLVGIGWVSYSKVPTPVTSQPCLFCAYVPNDSPVSGVQNHIFFSSSHRGKKMTHLSAFKGSIHISFLPLTVAPLLVSFHPTFSCQALLLLESACNFHSVASSPLGDYHSPHVITSLPK